MKYKKVFFNMINNIKKFINSSYFPFFVYGIIMLCFHFYIQLNTVDDITFSGVLDYKNMGDWLHDRYFQWSSRTIIEFWVVIIARYQTLWRILDSLIMVGIGLGLSKLLNDRKSKTLNWFIVLILCSLPMNFLSNAGWIATTTNYSWPIFCGIVSFIPIKNIIMGKKNKWYNCVIAVLALIYAVNQELMCLFLLLLNLGVFVYLLIKTKKISWLLATEVFICFIVLIFILTCPGNDNRFSIEVIDRFPGFDNLTFFQKAWLGYSSTLYELIINSNLIFLILSFLIMFAVFIYNKKTIYKITAIVPIVVGLMLGKFHNIFSSAFPYLISLRAQWSTSGIGISYSSINGVFLVLLLTIVFICTLISIVGIIKNKYEMLLSIFIIGVGVLTRLSMGFSPTIWVSGGRTSLFMFFSIIVVSIILFDKIRKKMFEQEKIKKVVITSFVLHITILIENVLYYLNNL